MSLASRLPRDKPINVHPDLAKERENCPFYQEEVTNIFDGGTDKTIERRKFEEFLLNKIKVR